MCHCYETNIKFNSEEEIYILEKASKKHGRSNNRTRSLLKYSKINYRYEGYKTEDLIFIQENINQTILKKFGYSFDVNYFKN